MRPRWCVDACLAWFNSFFILPWQNPNIRMVFPQQAGSFFTETAAYGIPPFLSTLNLPSPLSCLSCSQAIRAHIANSDSNRLLIFPEGTCVNNQYCVQFKKGAFELGAEVCPIAMRYAFPRTFTHAFTRTQRKKEQHMCPVRTCTRACASRTCAHCEAANM